MATFRPTPACLQTRRIHSEPGSRTRRRPTLRSDRRRARRVLHDGLGLSITGRGVHPYGAQYRGSRRPRTGQGGLPYQSLRPDTARERTESGSGHVRSVGAGRRAELPGFPGAQGRDHTGREAGLNVDRRMCDEVARCGCSRQAAYTPNASANAGRRPGPPEAGLRVAASLAFYCTVKAPELLVSSSTINTPLPTYCNSIASSCEPLIDPAVPGVVCCPKSEV